ncbi:MAG: hypothetical protein HY059_09425 [Proteobacteria bacterium]|nr:hypothetical protein [Pseudomonadota bacterium]
MMALLFLIHSVASSAMGAQPAPDLAKCRRVPSVEIQGSVIVRIQKTPGAPRSQWRPIPSAESFANDQGHIVKLLDSDCVFSDDGFGRSYSASRWDPGYGENTRNEIIRALQRAYGKLIIFSDNGNLIQLADIVPGADTLRASRAEAMQAARKAVGDAARIGDPWKADVAPAAPGGQSAPSAAAPKNCPWNPRCPDYPYRR